MTGSRKPPKSGLFVSATSVAPPLPVNMPSVPSARKARNTILPDALIAAFPSDWKFGFVAVSISAVTGQPSPAKIASDPNPLRNATKTTVPEEFVARDTQEGATDQSLLVGGG